MSKLLLLSNSTNKGEQYMQWCKSAIASFVLGQSENIIFIPYAAVGFTYTEYTSKVNEALASEGICVKNLGDCNDKINAITNASAIFVGGGNTFHLLKTLQDENLIEAIQKSVNNGVLYAGWSAGSNVAGPTICTTNDMPIVEPRSFDALNLINFQINPHYTEDTLPKHGGESRLQRLTEYLAANKSESVACLPEATYLSVEDKKVTYVGKETGKVLTYKTESVLKNKESFSFIK
jgi:dipeptidase E